ncbi:MAG: hypothetical protein RR446_01525 [Lachnospiraceae bacterium]
MTKNYNSSNNADNATSKNIKDKTNGVNNGYASYMDEESKNKNSEMSKNKNVKTNSDK